MVLSTAGLPAGLEFATSCFDSFFTLNNSSSNSSGDNNEQEEEEGTLDLFAKDDQVRGKII